VKGTGERKNIECFVVPFGIGQPLVSALSSGFRPADPALDALFEIFFTAGSLSLRYSSMEEDFFFFRII
jgi:hypothetical protein